MKVRLPDNTELELAGRRERARSRPQAIGPGLAKAALAVKVDGELRDLARRCPTARASRSSPIAAPRRSS